jgi:hypothetical protein
MRVLAARFRDRGRANAVRDLLSRQLRLGAHDVDVAPLGIPGQEASDEFSVLAGRFHDDVAPKVADFMRLNGGEVVTNVDESWTKPRVPAPRPSWSSSLGRSGLRI